eukprot:11192429-Lingulodinium_polyedra.AAC.1
MLSLAGPPCGSLGGAASHVIPARRRDLATFQARVCLRARTRLRLLGRLPRSNSTGPSSSELVPTASPSIASGALP